MRGIALHQDVLVFFSRVWQTTCTAIRAGDEGFVVDSPVYPDELQALPAVLAQAGFPVSGLLATHGDWDHLLARGAFPEASLGVAETTAARLRAEPGAAQRELRAFDEQHYVEDRPPLGLSGIQELPVPGGLGLGATQELELHPTGGHTADGMAVFIPWAEVLVAGDYLSPVEIPMLSSGGSPAAYAATLGRLQALIARAAWIVPGHGAPLQRDAATRILEQDAAYVAALGAGSTDARLPDGRRSSRQRAIHLDNVSRLT
jgi:glyoxylase-like metal-dependent hydrolase (beta-lactamase superfamily II)